MIAEEVIAANGGDEDRAIQHIAEMAQAVRAAAPREEPA